MLRVGHARDAAVAADVGRDALERHHGAGARVLGDPRLLGVDDVHDDAALEHLGEARLDPQRADLGHALSVAALLSRVAGRGAPGHWGYVRCRSSARPASTAGGSESGPRLDRRRLRRGAARPERLGRLVVAVHGPLGRGRRRADLGADVRESLACRLHVQPRADDDRDREDQAEPRPEGAELVVGEELDDGEDREQDGERRARHGRRDRHGDVDVREPDHLPDEQRDREQAGEDAPPVPHAATDGGDAADVDFLPVEDRDDQKRDRAADDELRSVRQLRDVHVLGASFPRGRERFPL